MKENLFTLKLSERVDFKKTHTHTQTHIHTDMPAYVSMRVHTQIHSQKDTLTDTHVSVLPTDIVILCGNS